MKAYRGRGVNFTVYTWTVSGQLHGPVPTGEEIGWSINLLECLSF
jgi:hypothetical protein